MRCPHCGARHQEDGFKCTECGEMIKVVPKTTWKQIIVGAIVLIVLGILGFAFIYMNSNNVGIFAKDEPQSFNDYSWEELATISSDMTLAGNVDGAMREAKKHGFVAEDGSLRTDLTKEFELADGTKAQAHLIDVSHDPRSNNSGNAGMTFVVTVPMDEEGMNASATNAGGWDRAQLRASLNNDLFSQLPEDLQNYIVEVKKPTNNTGSTTSSDAVTITNDKLFAPSFVELMGVSEGDIGYAEVLNAEGSQYLLFENDSFKAEFEKQLAEGSALSWWLRSPNPETADQFFSQGAGYDTEQTTPLSMPANDKLSVVICFCI